MSRLPMRGAVLEIAAGSGEHAVHAATALPHLRWRPTDTDPGALASITAWRDQAGLANLLPPLHLDAADPDTWPTDPIVAVVNINMIHIAPWEASEGLMRGAGQLLPSGGGLFLYGPFIEPQVETAPSNVAFDLSLRSRNRAWGVRRLDALAALARANALELSERIVMPANNLMVIFRRT